MKYVALTLASALLVAAPIAALAQAPAYCSSATAPALPDGFSAFAQPDAIAAAAKAADQPEIQIGHAYVVTFSPVAQTAYSVAPRMVTPGSFGGLVMVTIDKAGVYSVAISDKIWVDVIRDGEALHPVAHQDGAPCSAIHKTVDFQLDPGQYTVQLSNAPAATATVEIVAR